MSNAVKIRILLLLLTLCFAGTAVTINLTYQEKEILLIDGRKVERNLHKKEALVKTFLANDKVFEKLKGVHENDKLKKQFIESLGEEQGIYLYTYSNNDLTFWGSEQIVPRSDAGISEGSSIITWDNGWYLSYKKSEGGFSAVCLIPIKANYPINNAFLVNDFSDDLITSSNLEVASYSDRAVYNLRNSDGEYLLSLKLRAPNSNTLYSRLGLIMWLLAGLTLTIFVNTLCFWVAKKGWVKLSVLAFGLFLFVIRYLDIEMQWLASNFYSGFFDPQVYASGYLTPSLGSLVLHILSIAWFVCYIYHCRRELKIVDTATPAPIPIQLAVYGVSAIILYYICNLATRIFGSLIKDSSINFEVNNLFNLTIYSWTGILLLCLVVLVTYLIIDILFVNIKALKVSRKREISLFVLTALISLIIKALTDDWSIPFFLFIAIIYLRGWHSDASKGFNLAVFVAILFLFAGIAAIKQNDFLERKLRGNQLVALQKLESYDDPNALSVFFDVEKRITEDPRLIDYFLYPNVENLLSIKEEIRKTYFGGYLSKYDFSSYFLSADSTKNHQRDISRSAYFKEKVIAGSRKVTGNFYLLNNVIGYINYFALLPIRTDGEIIGTLVVELKNHSLGRFPSYSEILLQGTVDLRDNYEDYSYAYYKNGVVSRQYGSFLYPVNPIYSPSNTRQYIQYGDDKGYNHISFKPTENDLLIISCKMQTGWEQLASLSFLFLVFLVFAILLYSLQWISNLLNDYDFNFRNLRWSVMILQNRILYSTRIQAFVVLAVVGTLVIAGIITFFSLSDQYSVQQERTIVGQLSQIAKGLENQFHKNSAAMRRLADGEEFNIASELNTVDASELNAVDLNLYNINGELIYTTQNKIYDLGLVSRFMNSRAWLNMNDYAREEFFHTEMIGELEFLVAYTPLRNDRNQTVAYLALPYFSNQKELDHQVGLLLNTIINVYALVLVALGLFAVFVANKITAPLTLVQKSLARTAIGKKNEPIFWKRNDEIGSLIKEYNNMIVALDNSANRIMRSERESAWREMAKQVAHEIKNPLTPLRLGVQLLERSWREKDPGFDEKFERFSHSFIEQIESLNRIASEFSNFAKMPDTKLDDVEIIDVITSAISIYNDNANVSIKFEGDLDQRIVVHGDRDQLLRTFNNLIKNAIEARFNNQKSIINITIGLRETGYVSITVQDFGKGIDELVRERIFQPNFTTKSSGTGLGLAFVKQTVESMGGSIVFKTEKGFGTIFTMVLPLKNRD